MMVRRMKSELKKNWDGSSRFPERKIEPLEVDYSDEEKRAPRAPAAVRRRSRHRAATTARGVATDFVLKTLKKRLFSSPPAFAITLQKHHDRRRWVSPTTRTTAATTARHR